MSTQKKIVQLIPIIVLTAIMVYSWYIFLATEISSMLPHEIGLGLFIAGVILYLFKLRWGVIGTGVFLLLATFNLIAIFPEIKTFHSNFTPRVQWDSFLLLLLYFCCVGGYLINLYLDHKERAKS